MKLLLDTHLVLWSMQDDSNLSNSARYWLEQAEKVYVSSATLWEIAIKVALGKLQVDCAKLENRLVEAGFLPLPITWTHAGQVRQLPHFHRDPFDRMLIAQAISEPLRLLTHDITLAQYSELVTLV